MNLVRFSLGGHSLGAYICAHYFDHFPEQIEKLYLLSPAGFNPVDEEFKAKFKVFLKNQTLVEKSLVKGLVNCQAKGESPFKYKFLFFFFIRIYLENIQLPKKDRKLIEKILNYQQHQKQYAEKCLGLCLYWFKSENPIRTFLVNHPSRFKDILIHYGDKDQMDSDDSVAFLKNNNLGLEVEIIEHADHMIILSNPEQVTSSMIKFAERNGVEEGQKKYPEVTY